MGRRKGSRDRNPEKSNRKRVKGLKEWYKTKEGKLHKQNLSDKFNNPEINPNKDRMVPIEIQKKRKATRMKSWAKEYRKTEKGKTSHRKSEHKRRGRLGFHPISLPLSIPYDWHHVNKIDVVAISHNIHNAVWHICGDGKLEGVIG